MKKTSLDKLILDLDKLSKNFNKTFEKKYDDIMARLFVIIGQSTAYDTGVSRGIIKSILSELGREDLQSELEHQVYEFWKRKEVRERDNVNYSFNKSDGRYSIQINDYGIGNQNEGVVSDIHPRQDNRVVPYNIDMALDKLETDSDAELVKEFGILEKTIREAIERGI